MWRIEIHCIGLEIDNGTMILHSSTIGTLLIDVDVASIHDIYLAHWHHWSLFVYTSSNQRKATH